MQKNEFVDHLNCKQLLRTKNIGNSVFIIVNLVETLDKPFKCERCDNFTVAFVF